MRKLVNKTNVQAPDADYPYGRAKDNPGNKTGTPVDENLLGDMIQFFEHLFAESGLVANELPDNDYSGFQLFEALLKRMVSSDGALGIKVKKMNIGAWNMTAGNRHMLHGLDVTKIISVEVMIINDAGNLRTPLIYADQVTGMCQGGWSMDATHIDLKATIGSGYESGSAWDDTSVNRGYIVFHYID